MSAPCIQAILNTTFYSQSSFLCPPYSNKKKLGYLFLKTYCVFIKWMKILICILKESFIVILLLNTVGLKISVTKKINLCKIATYFWYLWIFLTLPQVSYFWYVFGFQVALQSFFLKVGILSWNFLWTILMWKKLALEAFESISCPKISSKQQYLKFENFLTIFEKAENSNFEKKWLQRHLEAKHVSKIHYLW